MTNRHIGVARSLTAACVSLAMLWPQITFAGLELSYQVEQFSRRAHKMMGDHGVNALYKITINDVFQYLPNQHSIKRKTVRGIDDRLIPGKTLIKIARHRLLRENPLIKTATPKDFFGAFREGVPYTYVISHDKMSLTESTGVPMKEKYKDRYSKHYLLSRLMHKVHFAGEMHVYKNPRNKDVFLVFDNASGTYRPSSELLPDLKNLLDSNFIGEDVGLYFIAKSFDQKIDVNKLFNYDQQPFLPKQ